MLLLSHSETEQRISHPLQFLLRSPTFQLPQPLAAIDPLPTTSEPPMPPILTDSAGPSTTALPMETISISPHDFLAIMMAVRTFAAIFASFYIAHAALVERMARTEVVVSQNNVILMQIQSHLGLPQLPPIPPVLPRPLQLLHLAT